MRLTVSGLLMAAVWSLPGTLRLTDRIRSWSTMPMHYRGLDDYSQARALDMTAFDPAETIREYIATGHINRLIEVRRYMDDVGQYHASIKLAICVFQQRRDVLALQRRVYAQRFGTSPNGCARLCGRSAKKTKAPGMREGFCCA